MNKLILALAGFVAVAQSSITVFDIGTYLGELNVGACLGFQDDTTDETTTCYSSAITTAMYIQNIFDSSQYTNGAFNSAEMLSLAQVAEIGFLTEFNDCHLMEFLYAVNNRLTDPSFAAGLYSNIATQVSTVVGYYYGAQYYASTSTTISDALTTLFDQSTLVITYKELYAYAVAGEFQDMGTLLVQFITSLVNYKAPNVNTGRTTM